MRLDDVPSVPARTPGVQRVRLDDFYSVEVVSNTEAGESSETARTSRPGGSRRRNDREAERRAVAVPASHVHREQVEWLEPGRIPLRMVTVLAGVGGLGKSQLSCLLAAQNR